MSIFQFFNFIILNYLYILTPTGSNNFTIKADVTSTSGAVTTVTTVTLDGSTCIPLTGCSFVPPCAPTTEAIALQKLMNAIAATGVMCSSNISLSNPTIQPVFINSFGALLGAGNWEWQVDGILPNFIIKDVSGINANNLKVQFSAFSYCSVGTHSVLQIIKKF